MLTVRGSVCITEAWGPIFSIIHWWLQTRHFFDRHVGNNYEKRKKSVPKSGFKKKNILRNVSLHPNHWGARKHSVKYSSVWSHFWLRLFCRSDLNFPVEVCMGITVSVCACLCNCMCMCMCMSISIFIFMCMGMYVCVCSCACVCMHMSIYACERVPWIWMWCVRLWMSMYMYGFMYVYMFMYTYTCLNVCVYVYLYRYMYTHTYVCACIHICVHVCIVMSLNKKSFTNWHLLKSLLCLKSLAKNKKKSKMWCASNW